MKRSLFVLGIVCLIAAASVQAADIYVESRSTGQNFSSYSEAGAWADSTAKSTAGGLTATGSRLAYTTSGALTKIATFTLPASANSQWYEVFITTGTSTSNTTNGQTTVVHNGGSEVAAYNLLNSANVWKSLGQFQLTAGVSKVQLTFTLDEAGKRTTADAVKFTTLDIDTPTPTVPAPTMTPGIGDIYIESRAGGKNHEYYSETGSWADSALKSSAEGVTAGIGCRYIAMSFPNRQAKFVLPTPQVPGNYEVFVTYPQGPGKGRWWVGSQSGVTGGVKDSVDQTVNYNTWISLGQYQLVPGFSYVQVGGLTGDEQAETNFYADAVKFTGPLATATPTSTPMPTPTVSTGMDERYMRYE